MRYPQELLAVKLRPFRVGTVFNPIDKRIVSRPVLEAQSVSIKVGGRVSPMPFDFMGLLGQKRKMVWTYGELVLAIDRMTSCHVEVLPTSGGIDVSKNTKRPGIVKHVASIMKEALEIENEIHIEANNDLDLYHTGWGTSASIATSVGLGINHAFGNPIPIFKLPRYLAQNYGEEIEGSDSMLFPVQCTGGTSYSIIYGGILAIAGESVLLFRDKFPEEYSIVTGIPDYPPLDGKGSMENEMQTYDEIAKVARNNALDTAYDVLNILLPSLFARDYKTAAKIIWKYNSVNPITMFLNQMYPDFTDYLQELSQYKNDENILMGFYSSAGPGLNLVSMDSDYAVRCFENMGLSQIYVSKPIDTAYSIEIME